MNKKIEANYQQPITKHQSGITLVALVVTIIILLILGGTAISLISGEEGLFAKTNHAASLYNKTAQAEADRLNKIIEGNYISTKPLDPIPELKTTDLNISISPDTNINPRIYGSGVMVTLEEKEESGYQLQYSINGGQNYKNYTAPFEVTEYGTVILARLYDTETEREGDSTATYTVTNIDILPPNEFNLSASATSTSITVSANGTVTDADVTSTSAKSEIVKYEYKLDSGNWVIPTTATDTSYTFTGLTAGTSHTLSMRATDTAGNVREATNKEYSISTVKVYLYRPNDTEANQLTGGWTVSGVSRNPGGVSVTSTALNCSGTNPVALSIGSSNGTVKGGWWYHQNNIDYSQYSRLCIKCTANLTRYSSAAVVNVAGILNDGTTYTYVGSNQRSQICYTTAEDYSEEPFIIDLPTDKVFNKIGIYLQGQNSNAYCSVYEIWLEK